VSANRVAWLASRVKELLSGVILETLFVGIGLVDLKLDEHTVPKSDFI
jgi:hypothetical protein